MSGLSGSGPLGGPVFGVQAAIQGAQSEKPPDAPATKVELAPDPVYKERRSLWSRVVPGPVMPPGDDVRAKVR